jgi:ribosomal protein S2
MRFGKIIKTRAFRLLNSGSKFGFASLRLVEFTLLQLVQHNVHLGAAIKFSLLSSHWFIFGVRQKFAIINLSQTILLYRGFLQVVGGITISRKKVLLVNERRYSGSVVGDLALSVGEAYVMGRWVGGSITNFKRIWSMFQRTLRFVNEHNLSRFKLNLRNTLIGLAGLRSLPGLIFFNSIYHSQIAAGEARALRIPSGGVTDTDSYPHAILHAVPGNDDAFGSVFFLNKLVAKVVLLTKINLMVSLYEKFCVRTRRGVLRSFRKFKHNTKMKFTGRRGWKSPMSTNKQFRARNRTRRSGTPTDLHLNRPHSRAIKLVNSPYVSKKTG